MSELPTDAIRQMIDNNLDEAIVDDDVEKSRLGFNGDKQLQALLDDRDKWRNRSLAIEECLQDFQNQWENARDYPSKHDNTQGDKQ